MFWNLVNPGYGPIALNEGVGVPAWKLARRAAPVVAAPSGATIHVSGSAPSTLPAGNDTTGTGSAAAPYATLIKALSTVAAGGNVLILCDGTFAETSGSGFWAVSGNFTAPVLFKSYTGVAANFIITNASGTSGVIRFGNAAAKNIQFQYATVRSSTDANRPVYANAGGAAQRPTNIAFFDCVLEGRTQSGNTVGIFSFTGDFGFSGFYFVRCEFKRTVGGSTTVNPLIVNGNVNTVVTANQPNSDLGFWDCFTTGAFSQFGSGIVGGIDKVTVVRNTFVTSLNYGFNLGRDTSNDTTPKTTNIYVQGNTFTSSGTNPHAILIGSNCQATSTTPTETDGITVEENIVTTGLQGIVTKGSLNAVIQNNVVNHTATISGGSSLYAKASSGTVFQDNVVNLDGSSFVGTGFSEGPDGANLAGNTTYNRNRINATGANAVGLLWTGAAGSSGGASANDNTVTLASGATLGSVRGGAISTEAGWRGVWATNNLAGDNTANDSRSLVA